MQSPANKQYTVLDIGDSDKDDGSCTMSDRAKDAIEMKHISVSVLRDLIHSRSPSPVYP